jgi:colanic acid biosynthesis glycosyl transferase WcaI
MRIVFVNRFYWPDTAATGQLLTDLSISLASVGHEVIVVSSQSRSTPRPRIESHQGVTVIRIRASQDTGGMLPQKLTAFAAFTFGSMWWLLTNAARGDLIVALTDPPLIGIWSAIVAKLKRAKIAHWVQDIYPEIAITLTGHTWLRVLMPLRNAAWCSANACIGLSSEMASIFAAAAVPPAKIEILQNWAPAGLRAVSRESAEVMSLKERWDVEGKFVVGYSGNFGRVHDLMPLIHAAAELKNDDTVVFLLSGGGAQSGKLQNATKNLGLQNVRFAAHQSREHLNAALSAVDLHIISLRDGCEQFVFPSKLYGIAAVARPMLFIGPVQSEIARIVSESEMGATVSPDHPAQIATMIKDLQKSPDRLRRHGEAAAAFHAKMCADVALGRWHNLVRKIEAC